jgi:hypothetical protein
MTPLTPKRENEMKKEASYITSFTSFVSFPISLKLLSTLTHSRIKGIEEGKEAGHGDNNRFNIIPFPTLAHQTTDCQGDRF